MNINQIFNSKIFRGSVIVIAVLVVVLLIFAGGMFVGFKKANFSNRFAENYRRDFGDPRNGIIRKFGGKDFINPHGVAGVIIKIELATIDKSGQFDNNASRLPDKATPRLAATLIVKGQDNMEKTVLVTNLTMINKNRTVFKSADLKVDDKITIIGAPNELGQIEARLIRIFK